MGLYMFQGTYTPESWTSMTKNPQDRSTSLAELIQKLGGKLVNLYYCFGEYDVVAIFEAPDDITASAMVLRSSPLDMPEHQRRPNSSLYKRRLRQCRKPIV